MTIRQAGKTLTGRERQPELTFASPACRRRSSADFVDRCVLFMCDRRGRERERASERQSRAKVIVVVVASIQFNLSVPGRSSEII